MSEACCELHPPVTCGPAKCPTCAALGKPVARITLGSLIKPDQRHRIPPGKEFCFCRTPSCDVVYFRPNEALFRKADLSVPVTAKEPNNPAVPACYCFGWTPEKIRAEIQATGKSTVIEQIKAQVKAGNCSCEVTNPQGSCCLGNVARAVQKALGR
ncbi:MAG: copper chaperone Copz family protein [Candidatus Omnitrophica bacterium]|nr:copper chaperone Copz family protein [Candidatus Omnitrophota bacterium]